MVHLGRYYTDGVGAKPNPEKGIEWYTLHPIRPLVQPAASANPPLYPTPPHPAL